VIFRAVFVVKIAIIEKEMHSHKLSAMADNYPADWCINPLPQVTKETNHGQRLKTSIYITELNQLASRDYKAEMKEMTEINRT
jgi:hypothetical protein